MTASKSIEVARWCARQGWPVHPLQPNGKVPMPGCSRCRSAHPNHVPHAVGECGCLGVGLWCHGFHAATREPTLIDRWWGANPAMGVGISTGPAGLLVIDLDCHADTPPTNLSDVLPAFSVPENLLQTIGNGLDSFRVLSHVLNGEDFTGGERTLAVRTPSGGMHLYFRAPRQTSWRCSAGGNRNGVALGWQIDVRAHGGYIIAPGTRVEAGSYEPVGGCRRPALLPGWLAGALERTGHLLTARPPAQRRPQVPNRARMATTSPRTTSAWAAKVTSTALSDVADCASLREGSGWHAKVNRAAYTLGGLVAAGFITSSNDAESALLEAALHARPERKRQALSIIQSGLVAGQRQPLTPKDR
ncbi:bifunctional DNA primase/polymerase [Streptomyces sp. NPDC006692]|uniref:bifunctional DNA primase/polymerase n=1 Tax=unclassified Streptomyces TaxID=2593676 RepID=UPI00342631D2